MGNKRNVSLFAAFSSGALSGTCSTLLFQPLEVIKTRQQELVAVGKRQSATSTAMSLVRNEGFRCLWSGLFPSLYRCVPGVAVYFGSFEALKTLWVEEDRQLRAADGFALGATARCVAAILLIPFTVIKTRFESGSYKYASTLQAMSSIYKTEGLSGLSTGLGATVGRDVLFSALYLAAYTQLKITAGSKDNPSMIRDFGCGLAAGIAASIVTQPFDVVKTQLQLFPKNYAGKRSTSVLRSVYSAGGLSGWFAGLAPRLVRRTLISALSWTVYDQVRLRFVGQ